MNKIIKYWRLFLFRLALKRKYKFRIQQQKMLASSLRKMKKMDKQTEKILKKHKDPR